MAEVAEFTVEMRPVASLRANPKNYQKHTPDQIGRLADSLRTHGQAKPLVIMPDGELLAGHGLWEAMRSMDWQQAACHVYHGSNPTAYIVADNWLATLAEPDEAALAAVLKDLEAAGTLPDTGFNIQEFEELMARLEAMNPTPAKEEEWESPAELPEGPTRVQLGEIWQLGKHRVMCGDSTDGAAVAKLMDGKRAHLVFTDPPYGVGYDGGTVIREKLAGDSDTSLYEPACAMAAQFSDEKAPLYLWHAGIKGITAAAAAAAAAAGYEIRCEIVWNKSLAQFGALSAQYKQKHEPAYYCFKRGHAPRWFGPTNEVTVWDCDRAQVNEYHPTQKPTDLAVRAMGNSSQPGDLILDLFLGSGSTLIAAEQIGRTCYGSELDARYCDVILARWEKLTGQQAVRCD